MLSFDELYTKVFKWSLNPLVRARLTFCIKAPRSMQGQSDKDYNKYIIIHFQDLIAKENSGLLHLGSSFLFIEHDEKSCCDNVRRGKKLAVRRQLRPDYLNHVIWR